MRQLSYQVKVPLQIVLVVLVTTVAISAAALWHAWRNAESALVEHADSMGRVVSESVAPLMFREDVWRAWEVVSAATQEAGNSRQRPALVLVLDESQRTFISSQPGVYRIDSRPVAVDPEMERIEARIRRGYLGRLTAADTYYFLVPVVIEDARIGTVVLAYPRPGYMERLGDSLVPITATAGGVLLLLLPAGWWMGRRVAAPMIRLAEHMQTLGREPPGELARQLPEPRGSDEVGQLQRRFAEMLDALQEKEELERQVVRSDHLAAVGRLSAGIAHEINNPLGGMLNALNTYRQHGSPDPFTARTFSLLERGLVQVQEIVGALLVEARVDSKPLTPADVDDIQTLLGHDLRRRAVTVHWAVDLPERVDIAATPVRQILINLLLNAVRAAREGGEVSMSVTCREGEDLRIAVRNDGAHIPPDQRRRIFEPFVSGEGIGHGLGLWVTYQVVTQLGGEITVTSEPEDTCFRVSLPVKARERPES